MNCPRCSAWLLDGVVHLEDTESGLYAVVDAVVADHVVECRCGCDVAVTSARSGSGQLRLVQIAEKGAA